VDGVSAVGFLSGSSPLSGGSGRQSIVVPGYGEVTGDQMPQGRTVDPGYFEVMGIDLIAGRLFTDDDRYGGPPVMLMSRLAAARYFPHADAVGQVVQASGQRTVIGVVEDVYNFGAEVETVPQIYLPADQNRHTSADGRAYGGLMIKTSGDPRLLESDIRRAIRSVAGAEPQRLFFVVDDGFRRLTEGRRFNARLMLAFGIVAVVIAGAGVYGTMAFLVRRNIRSIGLRMAVGAEPRDIRTWVLSKAARYVVPGMAGGLFAAWLSSSAFASLVFGVDVASMPVYLFVAGLLVALGFAAALLPARRAARLDPVVALRHE
jgi:hypothetical protein